MDNFKKIKLYTDKKFLTQKEYVPILFPFWGPYPQPTDSLLGADFSAYLKNGQNYFELTDLENCDFILWPEKYNKNNFNQNQILINLAQRSHKPNLIFFADDSAEKIAVPNSYVFRTSLYQQSRDAREFALPTWSEDLTKKYFHNQLPLRAKAPRPTVSYCGYTRTWKDQFKGLLGIDYGVWRKIRSAAVQRLENNKNIATNFLIRQDFWGGAYKPRFGQNLAGWQKTKNQIKQEYINNLAQGDYNLCVRGQGNFSIRFYETLSLGRLPLFINTDCVLPYQKFIDWKKFCAWVDIDDLSEIAQKLWDFHRNISDQEFLAAQKEARQIWQNWLAPDGFFKNFYRHF
jgi:hypothetical protein